HHAGAVGGRSIGPQRGYERVRGGHALARTDRGTALDQPLDERDEEVLRIDDGLALPTGQDDHQLSLPPDPRKVSPRDRGGPRRGGEEVRRQELVQDVRSGRRDRAPRL